LAKMDYGDGLKSLIQRLEKGGRTTYRRLKPAATEHGGRCPPYICGIHVRYRVRTDLRACTPKYISNLGVGFAFRHAGVSAQKQDDHPALRGRSPLRKLEA
jgi:hypothetical protein